MPQKRCRTPALDRAATQRVVAALFIAAFAAILLHPRRVAGAVIGTWLELERAPGSEQCADADAVFSAIASLFPEREIRRSGDAATVAVKAIIVIRPTSLGHEALVRVVLPRPGERSLLVKREDCVGLADALAVALVMMLDAGPTPSALPPSPVQDAPASARGPSDVSTSFAVATTSSQTAEVESNVVLAPTATPEPTATAPDPETVATRDPNPPARSAAEIFAAPNVSYGLLGQPALGPALGVFIGHPSGFGLTGQGMRLWSLARERSPGSISLTLWGVLFGPCLHSRLSSQTTIAACLQLGLGQQRAETHGYLQPGHASAPWVVLGPSVGLYRELARRLRGFVHLGVIGQLKRESFSVEGLDGAVAPASRAGLWAEVGLGFGSGSF